MNLVQAILYFFREATANLLRSWKVGLLAIFTIAVSLFLTGAFLVLAHNLSQVVELWRSESKIVVYLAEGVALTDQTALADEIEAEPWSLAVTRVSPEEAAERFASSFPSMADLLNGWGDEPLPASLEVRVDRVRDAETPARSEALEASVRTLREDPRVAMVDDDRDWLARLDTLVLVLQGLATLVGGVLLLTAVFTISSVIRLTAYLYKDEIAVMRLVGATEFFIRGPFYVEGLLQGLLGGVAAWIALFGVHGGLQARADSPLARMLTEDFLPWTQVVALLVAGALAGLIGAISSVRRESLGQTAEEIDAES